MFRLTEADHTRTILGCGDGPAAFQATARALGWSVVSCDPIYRHPPDAIRQRIAATRTEILGQITARREQYVWDEIRDVAHLEAVRMSAMESFLADYEAGYGTPRYRDAELPQLPFAADAFELAVCSHLLFLYSTQLDRATHLAAIAELLRVAAEVRIFPLIALDGTMSPHLAAVLEWAQSQSVDATIVPVDYHFQRGADAMLRLQRRG
ncbi:hypothetical protein [Tuwongella immobilis]|nr:hypothetical protein [Tuwongella immobilis]